MRVNESLNSMRSHLVRVLSGAVGGGEDWARGRRGVSPKFTICDL